jgi:hypothetical protein
MTNTINDIINQKKKQLSKNAYEYYEKYVEPIPMKTRTDGNIKL